MTETNVPPSRIDRIRDSALSMTVGDDSDGAIVTMATIDEQLYTIKERSIYVLALADSIDPGRTRADIPNTTQKVFDIGSESLVVKRILLTALELFNKDRMVANTDWGAALSITVNILRNVSAAAEVAAEVDLVLAKAKDLKIATKSGALALPSFPGLVSQVKSFVQKSDHAMQDVFSLCAVFYGEETLRQSGKWLEGLTNHLSTSLDPKDEFIAFAGSLAELGKFVRNIRHCVEHKKPKQKLNILDYRLNSDRVIEQPTVAVIHGSSPVDPTPVDEFMHHILDQIVSGAEVLMAYLPSKHMAPMGAFQVAVGEVPEDQQRFGVRFGYLVNMNGRAQRLG